MIDINKYNPFKRNINKKMHELQAMANDSFNIIRCEDGIDYIYYNKVRVSTAEDAKGNLLARIDELRSTYVNERL